MGKTVAVVVLGAIITEVVDMMLGIKIRESAGSLAVCAHYLVYVWWGIAIERVNQG